MTDHDQDGAARTASCGGARDDHPDRPVTPSRLRSWLGGLRKVGGPQPGAYPSRNTVTWTDAPGGLGVGDLPGCSGPPGTAVQEGSASVERVPNRLQDGIATQARADRAADLHPVPAGSGRQVDRGSRAGALGDTDRADGRPTADESRVLAGTLGALLLDARTARGVSASGLTGPLPAWSAASSSSRPTRAR